MTPNDANSESKRRRARTHTHTRAPRAHTGNVLFVVDVMGLALLRRTGGRARKQAAAHSAGSCQSVAAFDPKASFISIVGWPVVVAAAVFIGAIQLLEQTNASGIRAGERAKERKNERPLAMRSAARPPARLPARRLANERHHFESARQRTKLTLAHCATAAPNSRHLARFANSLTFAARSQLSACGAPRKCSTRLCLRARV